MKRQFSIFLWNANVVKSSAQQSLLIFLALALTFILNIQFQSRSSTKQIGSFDLLRIRGHYQHCSKLYIIYVRLIIESFLKSLSQRCQRFKCNYLVLLQITISFVAIMQMTFVRKLLSNLEIGFLKVYLAFIVQQQKLFSHLVTPGVSATTTLH